MSTRFAVAGRRFRKIVSVRVRFVADPKIRSQNVRRRFGRTGLEASRRFRANGRDVTPDRCRTFVIGTAVVRQLLRNPLDAYLRRPVKLSPP